MTPAEEKKATEEAERAHRERRDRLHKQADRGTDAETAIRVLREVIEELHDDALKTFENSHVFDTRAHAAAKFYLNILKDTHERLEARVTSGEVARQKLLKLPKKPGILRRMVNG